MISCSSNKQRILKYNQKTQFAEYMILENNYDKALLNYKRALKIKTNIIAKDVLIAVQVSCQQNNLKAALNFIQISFENGLKPEIYYNDSIIKPFINENKLNIEIENSYKKSNTKYLSKINNFLNDTILKLSQLDNKWKVHYIDSLVNIDSKNESIYHLKYDSIVSQIVEKRLIPLIIKYGYPYYQVELEKNGNSYGNNRAKLILLHYYSQPKNCMYNQILKNEVFTGNLPAGMFAEIIDFQAKVGNSKYCDVGYYNEWHLDTNEENTDSINKRRQEIGLRSFQEKIRKYERGKRICKEIRENKNYKSVKLFYWCG